MSVKYKTVKNKIPDIVKTFEALDGRRVEVGVYGDSAWLARIHEYGCNIEAKKAKYLTVPIHPKARNKKAKSFKDLYCIKNEKGNLFLVRDVTRGKNKGKVEFLYWLTKSVKIPERSFLRAGFDEYINEVNKYSDTLMKKVFTGELSVDKYLDDLGSRLSSKIKKYARDLNKPENSNITQNNKGSDNPLKDTGQMIRDIGWRKD